MKLSEAKIECKFDTHTSLQPSDPSPLCSRDLRRRSLEHKRAGGSEDEAIHKEEPMGFL